jgi:hypothetical protein
MTKISGVIVIMSNFFVKYQKAFSFMHDLEGSDE